MREFPYGTQILTSPPPMHALRDRYDGRIAVLPDGREVLLDIAAIPSDLPAGYYVQSGEDLAPAGTPDETAAIQAAIDSAASHGATVNLGALHAD